MKEIKQTIKFTDKLSKAGICGASAGKALRESTKQFAQFEKAIKNMMPLCIFLFLNNT